MMTDTDFQKRLNLLMLHIREGASEMEAEREFEDVLNYAIFPREKNLAQEKYSEAMNSRKRIAT